MVFGQVNFDWTEVISGVERYGLEIMLMLHTFWLKITKKMFLKVRWLFKNSGGTISDFLKDFWDFFLDFQSKFYVNSTSIAKIILNRNFHKIASILRYFNHKIFYDSLLLKIWFICILLKKIKIAWHWSAHGNFMT